MSNEKKINIILLAVLILAFVLDQFCIGFQLTNKYRYATKTVLLPVLIMYYWINATKPNIAFLLGLVLSFFGDLFLLVKGGFIPGLSSFLLAHICYIFTFKTRIKQRNLSILPGILLYIIGLVSFLFKHLGVMKLPVIIYAITIGLMLYMAILTKDKLLIIGAFLFVLSDSILSINIFYQHSIIGSLAVMFTYVLAQYFLVNAMLFKEDSKTYSINKK